VVSVLLSRTLIFNSIKYRISGNFHKSPAPTPASDDSSRFIAPVTTAAPGAARSSVWRKSSTSTFKGAQSSDRATALEKFTTDTATSNGPTPAGRAGGTTTLTPAGLAAIIAALVLLLIIVVIVLVAWRRWASEREDLNGDYEIETEFHEEGAGEPELTGLEGEEFDFLTQEAMTAEGSEFEIFDSGPEEGLFGY
jgi:hypothetical protein